MILILALVYLLWHKPLPEGAVPQRDIVSYCTGDATNDGVPELLLISGNGKIDTGERHGGLLLVCDASAEADMDSLSYIPPEKILYTIDISAIKPMKVQIGDVTGDGVDEVALCVYKTTKFYPELEKRPFFFDLVEGNLIPVWLGSRLSRPFDDYILYDIDDDAIDEIISIERLESGQRVIAVYNWRGFGFEMLTESEAFDGALRFDSRAGQPADIKEIYALFSNNGEQTKLIIRLNENKLLLTKQS
jgi:hypothetical protein